jgi:hypothetical protein
MPTISKNCSVFNAFNFKRDRHESIGHVTALKIGETQYTADLTLDEPIEEADTKVVGAISNVTWEGGYAQPIQLTMQVSIDNKNLLATLIHTEMKSLKMEVTFTVYEYDRDAHCFYKSLHTNDAALACLMQVQSHERVIYLSDEPGMEVEQPLNYQLMLGIVPEEQQQEIHLAVSNTQKFVKPWGITRG